MSTIPASSSLVSLASVSSEDRDSFVSVTDAPLPTLNSTQNDVAVQSEHQVSRKPRRIVVRLRDDGLGVLGDPTLWATVVSKNCDTQTQRHLGSTPRNQHSRPTAANSRRPLKSHPRQSSHPNQLKIKAKKPTNTPLQRSCRPEAVFRHGKKKKQGHRLFRLQVENKPIRNRCHARRIPKLTPNQQFLPPFLSPYQRSAIPYYPGSPGHPILQPYPFFWTGHLPTPLSNQSPMKWL